MFYWGVFNMSLKFKENDWGNAENLTSKGNTEYFKPFDKEVHKWKKKYEMGFISLEFKDLFESIRKYGFSDKKTGDNKKQT